jgi:hypothetical protein
LTIAKQPYGPWPKNKKMKQAGMLALIQSETVFHSYGMALYTRVLGMSTEEAMKVCDEGRDAILFRVKQEKVHSYTPL